MIRATISLYRARKDPALTARLAGELAVEGTLDRLAAPLWIAKAWLGVGIVICALAFGLAVVGAAYLHGSLALFALPFGLIGYALIRIWIGLNRGRDHVVKFANATLAQGLDKLRSQD